MANSTPKAARKGARPTRAPASVPDPAPAVTTVGAMSAPRFSAWHIVAIVSGVLAVAAVACLAGAAVGFGYGRAMAVPAFGMHSFMLPRGSVDPFGGDRQMPFPFGDEMPYGLTEPRPAGAAYLGVTYEAVGADQADQEGLSDGEGALVSTVLDGSPAAAAGIRAGDIILAVDGHRVVRTELLRRLVRARAPGDEISLLVLRNGMEQTMDVTLGQAPDAQTP